MTVAALITIAALVDYFNELLKKFIEVNQTFYKDQKFLTQKSREHLDSSKKISSNISTTKRLVNRLGEYVNKLNKGDK